MSELTILREMSNDISRLTILEFINIGMYDIDNIMHNDWCLLMGFYETRYLLTGLV